MPLQQAPIPTLEMVVQPPRFKNDKLAWLMSTRWVEYLAAIVQNVDDSPRRIGSVFLEDQGASIGATDFSAGNSGAGLYRINFYARISRPATTSSSLTVTFDWTTDGVTQSFSGPAITGNATNSNQPDKGLLIQIDSATPVRYSTTYASVGATSMQYQLSIVLERVQA